MSISLAAFTAADPSDHTPPAAGISSPEDGGEITAPTDVIGTVYDAGLSRFILEYARRGENDWTALAVGSASATNAPLGRFDPTLLKNGLYDLRLPACGLFVNYLTIYRRRPIPKTRRRTDSGQNTPGVGVKIRHKHTLNNFAWLSVVIFLGLYSWPLSFHSEMIVETMEVYKK